ncbi:MAG: ArnT family glycosyltransferase [Anaerolineae bacterium]
MNAAARRTVFVAILALFLALGVIYSVVDPVFEASDELHHYPVVKHLADGAGLPVQRPGEDSLWRQEGSQPPLYYAVAALGTFWIDTDDLPEILRYNPHAQVGIPLAADNKNMIVHTEAESWPWRGTALAVHLIRLLSLCMAAGTLVCTYLLGRRIFPDRPEIALSAMALNAFLPMFLFISASVNNDNLVVLLASWALLRMVIVMQDGPTTGRMLGLGVLIGLAALTKLSALGLVPLAGLALALGRVGGLFRPDGDHAKLGRARVLSAPVVRRILADLALMAVPTVVIAGWWYLRNLQLYGDPTGLNAMLAIAGRRPETPSLGELLGEFEGLRINYWGLFGGVNVLMEPHALYRLLDVFTLVIVAGLVLVLYRAWQARRLPNWPALALLACWFAIEAVALVRWTSMTKASQGRLLFPAITGLSLLGALGWSGLRRSTRSLRWNALPPLALAILAAAAPWTAIRPAYAQAAALTVAEIPASAQRIDAVYGGGMHLLAYEVTMPAVQPGEDVTVVLYWEALSALDEDYSVSVHLSGRSGQPLGQVDSYPGGGSSPTSQWAPGTVVRDVHHVRVRLDAETPVAARVEVSVYRHETGAALPIVDGQGQSIGLVTAGRVKVAQTTPALELAKALDANLEGRARLTGYTLDARTIAPGDAIPLVLRWEVTGAFDADYVVFVHLVDEAGNKVGQGDGPPLDGDYPTSYWEAGETLLDVHTLQVGDTVPAGLLRVLVGLYDRDTGRRLPVLDAQGTANGDTVLLATLWGPNE